MSEFARKSLKPCMVFKLVLLGESMVGKTTLFLLFVSDKYRTYNNIVCASETFILKTVVLENSVIRFGIWDNPSLKQFWNVTFMYHHDTDSAIVVYDITNKDSFEKAKAWVQELQKEILRIVIALVGNKMDLAKIRAVESCEAQQYAAEKDLIFKELSALSYENVIEVLSAIGEKLHKKTQETLK